MNQGLKIMNYLDNDLIIENYRTGALHKNAGLKHNNTKI
jgi:hypothetical protein